MRRTEHTMPEWLQFRFFQCKRLFPIEQGHRLRVAHVEIRKHFVRFLNVQMLTNLFDLVGSDAMILFEVDKVKRVLNIVLSDEFSKCVEILTRRRFWKLWSHFRLFFFFTFLFLGRIILFNMRNFLLQINRRPGHFTTMRALIAAAAMSILLRVIISKRYKLTKITATTTTTMVARFIVIATAISTVSTAISSAAISKSATTSVLIITLVTTS
mmetsp:Transcript_36180/g.59415  ORF Transcript_36180/g.59415 Transcript_36180/m.59415 type:complete len:213 (-) Transcript_36180:1007-1645(-)